MPKTNLLPVVVIGFGGHGRVVTDALLAAGRTIVAVTDRKTDEPFAQRIGLSLLSDEGLLERHPPGTVELASGLGSIWPCGKESHRQSVIRKFEQRGYRFTGFVHPAAWVSPWAVLQPGTAVGAHTIINTSASVDHDGDIGCFCHVGPGVTLSGNVRLGDGSHLGTGCRVFQGIVLGPACFVAAGSTVVTNISAGEHVRGTPAKSFQPRV